MKCQECGSVMSLDDGYVSSPGCVVYLWNCPCCSISCIQELRYGRSYRESWHFFNQSPYQEVVQDES